MSKVYRDLFEAHSEIKRDLAKSPTVSGQRVQNKLVNTEQQELTNYTYTVLSLPDRGEQLYEIAQELGIWTEYPRQRMIRWLEHELTARLYGHSTSQTSSHVEFMNPALEAVKEGEESSYYYCDRLLGLVDQLGKILSRDKTSRRAFFPMFQPEDTKRASLFTRIPCTLGYHAFIRNIDSEPYLHFTYLQRSCDFKTFWISDLYFAHQLQVALAQHLNIPPGVLTHIALSLHSFVAGEEIY